MISELDLNIYQTLFQQKTLSEKHIGKVEFDWFYSEVNYTAEHTIGVPFDLFDKTIVGILQVDEVLSIEEIGDILGLNVVHSPEKQQYRDDAEFDILCIALDSLKNYGMIETGDIYYSSCRLTHIGREYAQKGKKFKIQANKPFSLFYDHTTDNHLTAKSVFQNLKGKNLSLLKDDFNFLDEVQMKEIAEKQEPQIYNVEIGNSFTNPKINVQQSQTYCLKLYIVLLLNLDTNEIRLLAYEPNTKRIIDYFTDWLNKNEKNEIIAQFISENSFYGITKVMPTDYIKTLIQIQQDFDAEITQNPEKAMMLAKKANQNLDYIDIAYFWGNLKGFIPLDIKEIWFYLTEYNDRIFKALKGLKSIGKPIFLVFQHTDDIQLYQAILEMYEESLSIETLFYVIITKKLSSFSAYFIGENSQKFYSEKFNIGEKYEFLWECIDSSKRNEEYIFNDIKIKFANSYLDKILADIQDISNQNVNLSKANILALKDIDKKAQVFIDLQENEEILQQVFNIEKTKNTFIAQLKEKHQNVLQSALAELLSDFEKNEFSKLESLHTYNKKLKDLESECFEDYKVLIIQIEQFKAKITEEEKRIKEEVLAKTYIIDTNVFIEEPDIITKIERKHYVALTLTAIEELDKLKTQDRTKEKASTAIKYINEALQQANKQKKPRVKKAKANLSLLPEELQKKSGDNYLLSMGIIYKSENPIILTVDTNLQSKAMMLDIPTISLKEFLGIKEQPNILVKVKSNGIDYMTVFKQMQPNKKGFYQISSFIEMLKKQNPTFDYKVLGFQKAWQFVESLKYFKVTDKQFINLKSK